MAGYIIEDMITTVFSVLSILAIVLGGLISAFSARKPTRFTSWVSAYLVLVVGVIQLGLVTMWHQLGQPENAIALAAFLFYNLGNLGVITGTMSKKTLSYYPVLVNLGGILIALAMALLLLAIRSLSFSGALVVFVVLAVIILVSMPIGLVLSSKRHKEVMV